MFSTAEKTSKTAASAPKQGAAGSFFRKAEVVEPSFFGGGSFIQPKLSVSSPDDPHEKEADAVADHVMRMPDTATPQLKQEDHEVQRKTAADDDKKELHPKLETPAITAIQCKEEEGNVSDTEVIQTALLQRHGRAPPTPITGFEQQLTHSKGEGSALPGSTRQFMETRFGADFSGVRIHTGTAAESLSGSIQAQAFTHGNDIYFNTGKYAPDTGAGGVLLAHELTHTIQQGASKSVASGAHAVSRKPILQRTASDRPVPSQLNSAVAKAKSEVGKVNADKEGADGYRTGWDRLVEYFKTTLGADKVLPQGAAMVQGAVAEQDIKKKRTTEGMPPANPRPASGPYQRDAMPSWCGIFVFWSLHKGGVPMNPWTLGGHNIDLNAAYPPGYHPKAGDIAYRDRFSHYAIVEKSSGDTVTTVNGNTAGEDNLGGQVQVKDHPLAEWTGFFDPLMMKNGELGTGEQSAEAAKPKTLRELRQELFHVNRKMQDGPEPEHDMTEEVHLQAKQEPLSNWQVNEGGHLTHAPSVVQPAVQAKEEPVQQKDEEHKEEEEKRAPVPVQLKTAEPKLQRSWLSDAWSTVSNAVGDLVAQGLEAGKRILLREARDFAMAIPGYRALRVVLGEDPITNEVVERNGHNFIEAAFDIMPGGQLLHQKLEELGALTDAEAWVDQQIANITSVVQRIVTSVENFWSSLSLDDLGSPQRVFERIGNIIHDTISSIVRFAVNAASELLSIVKRFLLNQLVSFVREHTTAYPLLCVILGEDPITHQQVAKNGTNILNALLELGGEEGREQRRQMQDTGTFQRIAGWIDRGILVFSNAYEQIRAGIASIWDFVSIESLMHPIDTFNRIYNIFAPPIQQVWNFVSEVAAVILRFIKEVLLRRLSNWARTVRGYQLLTVIIGKDPFTDEVVPRTMENIIRGFMSLMEGGLEQFNQLKESGAIDRTTQRINAAVDRLNMTPAGIVQLFMNLWRSMSLNDLIHPIDAFRRIVATFGEPIGRLVAFVVEIVKIVVEVILQVMNFPTDLISNIITKAMQAFEMIKRDPVGFLKNLLRAIKEGFTQFFNNILRHLLNGLTGWLMSELRDANVPAPQDFSLRGIISWVLQVLGLSMETIWQKLSEHPRIGPQRVARIRSMINTLEGIWTFIRDVQERGIAAIWDRIQEQLSNLWNTILDAVKNWVMEQIVNRIVTRLLSMLDPTGIMAVINSAIALYRAVQSFIRYLREMLTVVNSFVEGVVEIASGNTRRAADFLENSLDRAMPIVIGFLANQVGLSGVGRRIAELIGAARQLVDRAVTWLVNRAVDTGFAILDRLMAMGRSAVNAAVSWASGVLGLQAPFTTSDSASHRIFFTQSGDTVKLRLNPSPEGDYEVKINEINTPPAPNDRVQINGAISVPLKRNNQVVSTVVVTPESDGKVGLATLKSKALEVARHINGLIDSNRRTATDTTTQVQDQTPDFSASLDGLSQITRYLLSTSSNGPIPVTPEPTHGGLTGGFANTMRVKPLTKLGVPGTGVSITSPAYQDLLLRRETPGGRSYYIAGHLLNNNVHGSGNNWQNLTPIVQRTNAEHERRVESKVKDAVERDKILEYAVNVVYNIPEKTNLIQQIESQAGWQTNSILNEKHRIIRAEALLPKKLVCTVKQIKADGTDLAAGEPGYDPQYNISGGGGEIDNESNVLQNSLDNYYLTNATAVSYKPYTQLETEAGNAAGRAITWDAFYNDPANKVSIDSTTNVSALQRGALMRIFRRAEIMREEQQRINQLDSASSPGYINRLNDMPTWNGFAGGRVAYAASTDPLDVANATTLRNAFTAKMTSIKTRLMAAETTYVNGLNNTQIIGWGEYKRNRGLFEKEYFPETEIDTFKQASFDPAMARLQATLPSTH